MANAVFATKILPDYDDLPEKLYHFPKTYLWQARAALRDWIIYYEPRRSTSDPTSRGGRQAHFATAFLEGIEEHPVQSDHYLALVSNYLDFARPVSFVEQSHYYEAALRKADGSTNKGAFGRSVRPLGEGEYEAIWRAAFGSVLNLPKLDRGEGAIPEDMLAQPERIAEWSLAFEADEPFEIERVVREQRSSRPFRDAAFAVGVKTAYGNRCAFTGLRFEDSNGLFEAEAAHIRPVAHRGPDSIRNGVLATRTAHWLFDHGFVGISHDYRIMLREQAADHPKLKELRGRRLLLPEARDLWPHQNYLDYHREFVFGR